MIVVEAPELGALEDGLLITLGGGSLRILELSIGDGGDGGVDGDDSGEERSLLFVFFVVVLLLSLLLAGGANEFVVGGGGMGRPGPFDGKNAVPSASAEA